MPMHISGLAPVAPRIEPATSGIGSGLGSSSSATAGGSFSDALSSAINQVEGARGDADKTVEQFLSGDGQDLHSAILSSQRAELEFQLFMQVRNKVVSAYQEIMRMPM